MRANEFINEVAPALAIAKMVPQAAKVLGRGAKSIVGTAAPKVISTLGKSMASVINKGSGSYVGKKTAEPPKPGTVGTNQTNSQPVAKGDTIDNPALGGPVKVKNVTGTDVELEVPNMPGATLKMPKKDLGVR